MTLGLHDIAAAMNRHETVAGFKANEPEAFEIAKTRGWLRLRWSAGVKWQPQTIRMAAKLCKNRRAFFDRFPGAYKAARTMGSRNVLFPPKPPKWNEQTVREAAARCANDAEFRRRFRGASAYRERHGPKLFKDRKVWTRETAHAEARRVGGSRWTFQTEARGAYLAAARNGWLDDWYEPGRGGGLIL